MTWLVHFDGFECVKPSNFAVVVSIDPKKKTEKTKEREKVDEEAFFSCVSRLGEEQQ